MAPDVQDDDKDDDGDDDLSWLAAEVRDLWVPRGAHAVPRLPAPPDPLDFLRAHVMMSVPCIVRGGMDGPEWSRARAWTIDSLAARMGDAEVSINVTPDGLGDAVKREGGAALFVKPEERRMPFSRFAELLRAGADAAGEVVYLSEQNDNLRTEHAALVEDVPASVDWFARAVGCEPEALNLWVGDARAVTSAHSDTYENLYCVLAGCKRFTLLPPTDPIGEDLLERAPARYVRAPGGAWAIERDAPGPGPARVPWIEADPADSAQLRAGSAAVTIDVRAGEMLYLPSMWYHRVTQTEPTIAVNYCARARAQAAPRRAPHPPLCHDRAARSCAPAASWRAQGTTPWLQASAPCSCSRSSSAGCSAGARSRPRLPHDRPAFVAGLPCDRVCLCVP